MMYMGGGGGKSFTQFLQKGDIACKIVIGFGKAGGKHT